MDFFAHLLWTLIFFYEPNIVLLLIMELFGVIPDLIPFVPMVIWDATHGQPIRRMRKTKDITEIAPKIFFKIYNMTHSFVIFGISFLIAFIVFNKFAFLLLPWALHVLFDIFTHSKPKDEFQTTFIYPISENSFKGYSWQYPKALIVNYLLIALGLIIRFIFLTNCYINFGV